ncbi:MAG: HAD family hydrolase [Steroidobacteraceae bacterium]|jgi:putative hydrolase of the HAD superfamily|nr:HAD family hydrolase [Steroidobacteraceae bacterium]
MPSRLRAVSLDLDDTLWETLPVLANAEARLLGWLEVHYPRLAAAYDPVTARARRVAIAREHPGFAHDMTWLRTESLRRAALEVGYPEACALEAFEVFHAARNAIDPYADVRPALARLSARVPVYALSNGNACVKRVGLGDFFVGAVAPHHAGAAKPDARIFRHLLELAGCAPHEVLHVGDDPHTDVGGARAAGLASAWMNRSGQPWPADLPRADHEVRDMSELVALVEGLLARRSA